MQKAIEKARTLVEALTYIQQYSGKIVVIKFGGSVMDSPEAFVQGRRYTDQRTLTVAEHVLCNEINGGIVETIQSLGPRAMGLHTLSSCVLFGERLYLEESGRKIDLGMVGKVTGVNARLVELLCRAGTIPVIAPLAVDKTGQKLNCNADTAAGDVVVSDTHGIRRDMDDPASMIPKISEAEIRELIDSGVISSGMLPKVEKLKFASLSTAALFRPGCCPRSKLAWGHSMQASTHYRWPIYALAATGNFLRQRRGHTYNQRPGGLNMQKDFINLADFTPEQLSGLIDKTIADKPAYQACRGPAPLARKTLALIFEKPSLRTRVSFEVAMTQLGGTSTYLDQMTIGLGSRESVEDISRVLSGWPDAGVRGRRQQCRAKPGGRVREARYEVRPLCPA